VSIALYGVPDQWQVLCAGSIHHRQRGSPNAIASTTRGLCDDDPKARPAATDYDRYAGQELNLRNCAGWAALQEQEYRVCDV
jgi:hypothetical protein